MCVGFDCLVFGLFISAAFFVMSSLYVLSARFVFLLFVFFYFFFGVMYGVLFFFNCFLCFGGISVIVLYVCVCVLCLMKCYLLCVMSGVKNVVGVIVCVVFGEVLWLDDVVCFMFLCLCVLWIVCFMVMIVCVVLCVCGLNFEKC